MEDRLDINKPENNPLNGHSHSENSPAEPNLYSTTEASSKSKDSNRELGPEEIRLSNNQFTSKTAVEPPPLPSCPSLFDPQQYALLLATAQLFMLDAEMYVTVLPLNTPVFTTVTGAILPVDVPSPSWPRVPEPWSPLLPQQYAALSAIVHP